MMPVALRKADLELPSVMISITFHLAVTLFLMANHFQNYPISLLSDKDAVKVIHMSFGISLLYNIIGLSFAIQGIMSPLFAAILMPISTVTIISFTSIMTRWYAKRHKL
jgi:Cu+-exporting ATPase